MTRVTVTLVLSLLASIVILYRYEHVERKGGHATVFSKSVLEQDQWKGSVVPLYFDLATLHYKLHPTEDVVLGGAIKSAIVGETQNIWLNVSNSNIVVYAHFASSRRIVIQTKTYYEQGKVRLEYNLPEMGYYRLIIFLIDSESFQKSVVQGSPFVLYAKPRTNSLFSNRNMNPTKPYCTNMSWLPGSYQIQIESSKTAFGYVWEPDDCHLHYFNPAVQLPHLSEKMWIVLTGSSVQRGTFFALLDAILKDKASNLTNSEFWKCWGWMDFSMGNFRLSYLDFRPWRGGISDNEVEQNYMDHAFEAFTYLGTHGDTSPDVIYTEISQSMSLSSVQTLKSWLGESFRGRFIVSIQKPRFATKLSFEAPEILKNESLLTDLGIEYIDEIHHALPMWPSMEGEPMLASKSNTAHYHQSCNMLDIHVCTIASVISYQLLLNAVLGHKVFTQSTRYVDQTHSTEFSFCLSCPKQLLPFTVNISRIQEPLCYKQIPHSNDDT